MSKFRAALLRFISFGRLHLVPDAAHADKVGDCWFEDRGLFEVFFVVTSIEKNARDQRVIEVERMAPPGPITIAVWIVTTAASAAALWYWLA